MTHLSPWRAHAAFAIALLIAAAGCVGGGSTRRPISLPGTAARGVTTPATGGSLQALYESGRYRDVLNSVSIGDRSAEALWFAGQSALRLGQRDEASQQFAQLRETTANPAWHAVSDLAQALLHDNADEIDRARAAAAAFPSDPFVQYQLGLAHARRNDMPAAAQAFDRCTEADPRFAYAYYNGGLAYDRLNRADLALARLETFQRLAPQAPERPEVETILQTVRGR
jgi:tetratricopeptide (TPR) repeat protein